MSCVRNVWNEGWVQPVFVQVSESGVRGVNSCSSSSLFLFRTAEEPMSGQRMIPDIPGEESCTEGYEEPCASWDLPVKYCNFWALSSGTGSSPFFSTNTLGSWGCHFGAGYTLSTYVIQPEQKCITWEHPGFFRVGNLHRGGVLRLCFAFCFLVLFL